MRRKSFEEMNCSVAQTLEVVRRVFRYAFEPEPSQSSAPRVNLHTITEEPFDLFGLEVIPILALAGALAGKKVVPANAGTFQTDRPLFVGLLIGVVLIVGALTFFPALTLGPILEQLQLAAGQLH